MGDGLTLEGWICVLVWVAVVLFAVVKKLLSKKG